MVEGAASEMSQRLRELLKDVDDRVLESAVKRLMGPGAPKESFSRDECIQRLEACVMSGRTIQDCLGGFVKCVIQRNKPCATRTWFVP